MSTSFLYFILTTFANSGYIRFSDIFGSTFESEEALTVFILYIHDAFKVSTYLLNCILFLKKNHKHQALRQKNKLNFRCGCSYYVSMYVHM